MLGQGIIVPYINKRIGDRAAIVGGLGGSALLIALMGLVPSGVAYVGLALVWLFCLMVNNASLNSLLTREVADSDIGKLQGASRSLNSAAGLLAPGLWALMLAWGIRIGGKPLSGIPYLVTAVLVALATIINARITRPRLQTSP